MDKSLIEILIGWFPMLLLVGVWIFFIWRTSGGPMTKYQADCFALAQRQAAALERIATVLEKRG